MTERDEDLAQRFAAAFRAHPAGVAIITADDGAGPAGLTATSVISLSARPAVLAFSLSAQSSASPRIEAAGTVVVHLLGAGEVELAKRFATGGIDRFAPPCRWHRLPTGEPVLSTVGTWLRGRIADRVPAGGSTLVVVDVEEADPGTAAEVPLVYRDRTWYALDERAVTT
ncbi:MULTISPECIES: flavin reductase family protein [Prauserella salsuginis group]|uniref:Flavin reductase family protein n=1 Tax=Prauserella salsuginis TaxID=387889 RepID=A0ABW6GBD1_9PSEU|nr:MULTISPECIES: flavin reductase family protein [Prauserella salsuginis group]MCR3722887.1 NADH-FMN oxidoreductase RutF, flavin reductase (DIM6/NTAB) family [Prauserella flava]MCR3737438.1 NADH-FMN oxidoreductase RutF, flavin reductase (DIM6/NTAB) family [Prauserella salsuginis]